MVQQPSSTPPVVREIEVRLVTRGEEARYQAQMAAQHYLGALPKIGETLWYIATWRGRWLAQLSLSAAALKCGVRDAWIGWDFRIQFDRLKLIANNGLNRTGFPGGWLRTTDASAVTPEEVFSMIADTTPLRRVTTPAEFADAILFFVSPWLRAVTGQNLVVDGGLVNN